MKITVFNGSPRAEKSNTHVIVKAFLKGAEKAGASTENVFLIRKKIKYCLGCFDCWTVKPGQCIIKDDMDQLLEKFISSDIVVLATPLYVDNVSGLMKTFFDRLIPLVDPHFTKDEKGETRHQKRYDKYPKFVIISNCGFPEQSHFQTLHLLFDRMARNMHTTVLGEIYRSQGEILQSTNKTVQLRVNAYLKAVEKAGEEIVTNGTISPGTQKNLEMKIIPGKLYSFGANRSWDSFISKKQRFKQF